MSTFDFQPAFGLHERGLFEGQQVQQRVIVHLLGPAPASAQKHFEKAELEGVRCQEDWQVMFESLLVDY